MAVAHPIVLIPGIKGTKLVETNRVSHDIIFSGVQMHYESVMDLELTPVFNRSHFDRRPDTIIHPGELESVAYGSFVDEASQDAIVFIFNYDWWLSLAENGKRLRAFLEYLANKGKAINKALKVEKKQERVDFSSFNIVTHSMGNFIARNYLKHWGFELVEKVVFVAPPFRGALSLAQVVVTGQGMFSTKQKIRKIIRTFPGALELMPHKPGYQTASRFDDGSGHDFFNADHWQSNVNDQRKDWGRKFRSTLESAGSAVAGELAELSDFGAEERRRMLVIARHGADTLQAVTVRKNTPAVSNFLDFKRACHNAYGDEQVAHASSCAFWESVQTLMVTDKTGFFNALSGLFTWEQLLGPHAMVMADDRVQTLVLDFFDADRPFEFRVPGDTVRPVVGLDVKRCEDAAEGHVYWVPKVGDAEDGEVLLEQDE